MSDPRSVKNFVDAQRIVDKRSLSHVKVGLFDIDGVMRGKYMSREKFFSALENGFAFCPSRRRRGRFVTGPCGRWPWKAAANTSPRPTT